MAEFYTRIEFDPALARTYVKLAEIAAAYRVKGEPAKAAQVRDIAARLRAQFEQLAGQGAQKADEFIREALRTTAVRPPTAGTLEHAVHSRPIPTTYPSGAIGIASIDALDKGAVNPRSGGIYWRAQEWGLPVDPSAKPVPGFFMPGAARPSQAEFRQHPYFERMPSARGMPALVRKRPLAARYYLRDGSHRFAAWHAAEFNRIITQAGAALLRL